MKSYIIRDIMPCSPLIISLCFGGTNRLYPQGGRISQARNQHEAGSKTSSACCLKPEKPIELCLVPTSFWFRSWDPKMEATCSSEMSVGS
jgi:hypothetical protein